VQLEVRRSRPLRFDDGAPVRAASALAPLGEGWLIAQDDATHAAWWTTDSTTRLRLFPPVDGHDVFSAADGTKALKPDLEAACAVSVGSAPGVVLIGSGSTPARTRAALVVLDGAGVRVATADLAPLYGAVVALLGITVDGLNIEGACRVGDRLRLFNRGNGPAGAASASVDVDLATLVEVLEGGGSADRLAVASSRRYRLGDAGGVPLTITDAVGLPDGRVLVSTAAEDTPNTFDDGPVVATGLALRRSGTQPGSRRSAVSRPRSRAWRCERSRPAARSWWRSSTPTIPTPPPPPSTWWSVGPDPDRSGGPCRPPGSGSPAGRVTGRSPSWPGCRPGRRA
jgi:hypothetical protein